MASRVIAAAEPVVVIAITPLLLFPSLRPGWTAAALTLLILVWVARAIVRRETFPVTPLNAALLLFCLAIPVAVWASAFPDVTVPKLTGLILGLAAFRAIGLSVRSRRDVVLALAVFGLLGLGIWAVGLLAGGFSFLAPLVQRAPAALIRALSGDDNSVNPNILAGGVVVYLPLTAALAVAAFKSGRRSLGTGLTVVCLLVLATLVLTRSRSALAGALVSVAVVGVLAVWLEAGRRGRIAAAAALVFLLAAGAVAGVLLLRGQPDILAGPTGGVGEADLLNKGMSLAARVDIWARAVYAIEDFPFTGVGLGTFPRVMPLLYPSFSVPPESQAVHAHNMFLQVGVDLGVVGLIAYVALLLTSAAAAWQTAKTGGGLVRYLALGLLASLIGLHAFGLTDALEAKPAIVLWVLFGLIAALPQLAASGNAGAGSPHLTE